MALEHYGFNEGIQIGAFGLILLIGGFFLVRLIIKMWIEDMISEAIYEHEHEMRHGK